MRGVFISHSSKDRAFTESVIAALGPPVRRDHPLPASDCVAIVDWEMVVDYEELQEGSPWPNQLHEWLARCHAGLVLLTKNAALSPWVLKEVTILTWRLARDPYFHLFIAQSGDVTSKLLGEQKFAPLDLGRIQRIDSDDPAAIAEAVKRRLGAGRPPRTPFEDFVGDVANLLRGTDALSKALAEDLAPALPAWKSTGPDEYFEEIARNLLAGEFGRLRDVAGLVRSLINSADVDKLQSLFDLVAPFWVDAVAAAELPLVSARTPPGVAAMNGDMLPIYTARMYTTRGHMSPYDHLYIQTIGVNAGDVVDDISRQIREYVESRKRPPLTNEQAAEWLATVGMPVYVILSFVPLPADLEILRRRFRAVTFVVCTGSRLDRTHEIADARWIEPELDTSIEFMQQRSYNTGMIMLDNKRKGVPIGPGDGP